MANRTIRGALPVHGKDPQLLVEKIIRERIYESLYWKEECFGLNAETVLDKAVEVDSVGGTFANQRPVPFLCLLLKLLQIQPTTEIVDAYIEQEDFKYLRVLGLFYYRLVEPAVAVYRKLEPYLADRRKVRIRISTGAYILTYVDEIVDELLTKDRVFDIILPRLTKRAILEDGNELESRPLFFPLDDEDYNSTIGEEAESHSQPIEIPDYRDRESLSIEETNELRKKLGLAPLAS
jgi:pre-mRNA-splicing factor 38A